jgi:hypothetical protein
VNIRVHERLNDDELLFIELSQELAFYTDKPGFLYHPEKAGVSIATTSASWSGSLAELYEIVKPHMKVR